jgi:hypothetical protein
MQHVDAEVASQASADLVAEGNEEGRVSWRDCAEAC